MPEHKVHHSEWRWCAICYEQGTNPFGFCDVCYEINGRPEGMKRA
jgi:predicted molibdopterin-dependent oxidoreductase YjgC